MDQDLRKNAVWECEGVESGLEQKRKDDILYKT